MHLKSQIPSKYKTVERPSNRAVLDFRNARLALRTTEFFFFLFLFTPCELKSIPGRLNKPTMTYFEQKRTMFVSFPQRSH